MYAYVCLSCYKSSDHRRDKKKKKLVGGEHGTYTLKLDFQFFISFL